MRESKFTSYDNLPLMLSVPEVAEVLGISRAGAYELVSSAGFPHIKIGNRILVPKVFDLDLKATTFLVYSYLVCCAGNKGSCWPSLETISRKTGLSISTVQEHLKILKQRQLISKSRHRSDGGWGKNNVYTLLSLDNPEVYRIPSVPDELPLHIGEGLPL